MDDNWENEGGAPAPVEEKVCAVCGEAGATIPSYFEPGSFLCFDALACLERAAEAMQRTRNQNV